MQGLSNSLALTDADSELAGSPSIRSTPAPPPTVPWPAAAVRSGPPVAYHPELYSPAAEAAGEAGGWVGEPMRQQAGRVAGAWQHGHPPAAAAPPLPAASAGQLLARLAADMALLPPGHGHAAASQWPQQVSTAARDAAAHGRMNSQALMQRQETPAGWHAPAAAPETQPGSPQVIQAHPDMLCCALTSLSP